MKRAHLILLSSVLASVVLLSLFSYSGQLAYIFYQSLDISGSEVNGVSKGCRDKTKLFGVIEVVDVDRYCQSGGTLEEQYSKSMDMGNVDGPIEKNGGTPRERHEEKVNSAYGEPSEQSSESRSYLPHIIAVVGFIIAFLIWRNVRRSKITHHDVLVTPAAEILQSEETSQQQHNRSHASIPTSVLRRELIEFEQALPVQKRRYSHETLSTWAKRIGLHVSLLPYFETRYDDIDELGTQDVSVFKRQLSDYLSDLEKE